MNKRPNYLFGQWDLGKLDNSGRCRRFVVQQIALDAMFDRIEHRGRLPYEEMLFEAAAVLAGTMLMGSGVSGNRPDAHDSSVTLATLVQHIAAYRDAFYEQLLAGCTARTASGCGPRRWRCASRSAACGSTSTSIWRGGGRSSCSTSTWPSCSRGWAIPRRRPAGRAWCRWPRRG